MYRALPCTSERLPSASPHCAAGLRPHDAFWRQRRCQDVGECSTLEEGCLAPPAGSASRQRQLMRASAPPDASAHLLQGFSDEGAKWYEAFLEKDGTLTL